MEPSGLNPQANPAVNQQNLTTPGMPAGRGAPGIPGSMPLFLQGGGASSIGWQYPAATGIAVGTSPIKRPTLLSGCSTSTVNATREDSTPRAALPGPMSGTSEQDAGSSIRQSSFLPAGCTQVPISILVFHRHRTGRGPVPRPPLSHTPIPASEGGFLDSEDAASIQSAPSDFLSLGRASNVAASGMAMNPSALAAPVNCDSELPPVNAEAPQTGMQAKDSQLSSSSLSEVVCDSHSRSESAFPANTEETEGQLLAEGVTDHNMHTPARKAKPRRKKHRAKVIREDKQRKKENPTVTTPEVKSPSQKAKRSYVRKKRSLSSLEKFSGHVNDQSISEVPENATRSRTASVRRRLQFEFGEQGAQGNQSSTGNSCHHVKEKLIQAKSSSCSATTILSTAKIGHGLHGDMENSAGGLSFGMSTPKATQEISPATSRCCNREPTREQDNVGSTHDLDITSMGVTITEENWELEVNYPKKHGFDMHRIPEMASTESQVTKVSKVEKKEHRQHREREPSLTDSQDSIILRTAAQMLAFCEAEAGVVKKKRSVRARRTFPTMNIEKNNAQKRTRLRQPCMEALCESPYIKFVTKKRSPNMHKKKMFSSGNSFPGGSIGSDGKFQKTLLQAPNRTTNLDICYEAPEDASSAPYMNFVPRVASRQEYLNLNTQHVHTNEMSLTTSAVVPFGATGGLSNSLVPFGGQMIFPYERPLHFDKKQRPRAKVNLDFETTRVWNLLMGKAAEPDGTDVGKERWWQQEREVFQGRANSFIARMRLVQGDRHFSPWKGSVVDSVVGVFLTQNVSDHLSSSAYMALAASFPPGLVNSNCKDDVTTKELECQRIKTTAVNDDGVGEHVMYYPFISVDRQQPDVTNEPCVSPTSPNSSLDSASSLLKNGTTGEKLPLFMPSDNHTSQSNCSKTVISTWNSPKTSTDLPVELHCDKSTRFEASDLQEHESLSATGGMIAETANGVDGFTSESGFTSYSGVPDKAAQASSPKKTRTSNKKDTEDIDWDKFRRQACDNGQMKERIFERRDSVDWEAVRCADVHRISHAIRERGMNNILAQRIQSFLNRLVIDHGSIDLEWLRDIPPDSANHFHIYTTTLTTQVDTNVGRICVRLGWVPIQPLPESLQLHLLELYPVLETVQKYLWPRLCKLDQDTLYELHYHMITFGKVFCTKSKPNCNACPLRSECRHFASAFASARLALPAPEEKSLVYSSNEFNFQNGGMPTPNSTVLLQLEGSTHGRDFLANNLEPIIEEPASPREEELPESFEDDIEDYDADTGEIPIIKLNFEAFVQSLENCTKESNMDLRADDIAKALVTISTEAASIPVPKLKNVRRLRTEHYVYELPDSHPLVQKIGLDQREPDDPSPYLLTIWMQDGIKETSKEPKPCCDSQMEAGFCNNRNCQYCVPEQDIQSRYVRGTILVPCRTAMKGSFPLNGTYFQVNEVFADHKSSHDPIDVARDDLWNLQRRMVYFGTSVPSIFKGLTTEEVQQCFWRGFVCVRGFDMQTRAPRPLCPHMHLAASKLPRSRKSEATEQNSDSARASVS